MFSGIYNLANRVEFENARQEVVARNLAGSQLPGFRREILQRVANRNDGGNASRLAGVQHVTDFRQGGLRLTARPLDFALNGPGFFVVDGTDGEPLYTRNGRFQIAPDRLLMTAEGYPVAGVDGPIHVPPELSVERLQVDAHGNLTIGKTVLGKLRLVEFEDPAELHRVSASYFTAGDHGAATEAVETRLVGHCLEESNISPLTEMAAMIESMREFEAAQTMLKMTDELLRKHMEP